MLDKLWSVHKVSMYKPYRDLTEAERVIDDIFQSFVKSTEVKGDIVVFTMITGEIYTARVLRRKKHELRT